MSAADKIIGTREREVLVRAYVASKGEAPHVMTLGERERLAARRLVERGLLVHTFPAAGPGHYLRKYYNITDAGRAYWEQGR